MQTCLGTSVAELVHVGKPGVLAGLLSGYVGTERERTDDLDLDVDLDQALAQRIDLHQAGIDCAVETAEFRDQADITLRDGLIWVRADNAAWNRS